jgi:hypothetical protein
VPGLAGGAPGSGLGDRRLASLGHGRGGITSVARGTAIGGAIDATARKARPPTGKTVDVLRHEEATRRVFLAVTPRAILIYLDFEWGLV